MLHQYGISGIRIERGALVVDAPQYSAVGSNGAHYTASAKAARAPLADTNSVHHGRLVLSWRGRAADAASGGATGVADMRKNIFTIPGTATLTDDAGLHGTLQQLEADLDAGIFVARGPVALTFRNGATLSAANMRFDSATELLDAASTSPTRRPICRRPARDAAGSRSIVAAAASSLSGGRAHPVKITSDHFVADDAQHAATFTGEVVVTRNDLTVWADKVVVALWRGRSLEHPQLHRDRQRQSQDHGPRPRPATRRSMTPRSQLLHLTGHVLVTNGKRQHRQRRSGRRPQVRPLDLLERQAAAASPGVFTRAMNERNETRVDQTGWLVAHGLAKSFGKPHRGLGCRRSRCAAARPWACSDRTAPARRRSSPSSWGWSNPTAARCGSTAMPITRLPLFQRGRLGIGYLPQEPSIFRGLIVSGQHPRGARRAHRRTARRGASGSTQLLDEFGLAHVADVNAQALSGGERRRAEIARAVAGDPVFMLLDEPFAGVDPIAVGEVKGLVRQLTQRGIGVLITDHSVRETLSLVDRAYLIHDGRVMIQGKPEIITNDPEARRVYLGESFSV